MGRTIAVAWHASFSLIAAGLYFLFVIPRWWELDYVTSHTLGTVLRIVCGALIGLAALPVVFTWLRTRKPEYGTPAMALGLRLWSVVMHVLGGVLIIGAAISEIWLSLDDAGRWLFGIYGAAAAISILGVFAFYLAFVAALPPPPPRPLKSKERKRRGRRKDRKDKGEEAAAEEPEEGAEGDAEAATEEAPAEAEEKGDDKPAEVTAEADESSSDEVQPSDEESPAPEDTVAVEAARGGLRNRRGKTTPRRRRRSRGGVAVED